MKGEVLPFDGWVALTVNLKGNENPNLSITVPFLVSSLVLERPLLGFYVLEVMIQEQPDKLIPTLTRLLCNTMVIPAEIAELLVNFLQTDKPPEQYGRLPTGRQDTVIFLQFKWPGSSAKSHPTWNCPTLSSCLSLMTTAYHWQDQMLEKAC